MKPIRFIPHAFEKLDLLRGWGFAIDEESIMNAIQQPQEVLVGYLGRSIAQIELDEEHVLRVVYEEGEEIIVVTLYPGRRQRYGD